jgi:hypothetical protein
MVSQASTLRTGPPAQTRSTAGLQTDPVRQGLHCGPVDVEGAIRTSL